MALYIISSGYHDRGMILEIPDCYPHSEKQSVLKSIDISRQSGKGDLDYENYIIAKIKRTLCQKEDCDCIRKYGIRCKPMPKR